MGAAREGAPGERRLTRSICVGRRRYASTEVLLLEMMPRVAQARRGDPGGGNWSQLHLGGCGIGLPCIRRHSTVCADKTCVDEQKAKMSILIV